jgi:hypothetical protein
MRALLVVAEGLAPMSATAVGHKHAWKATAHLDGCHYYANVYACTRCRATAQTAHERDPTHDRGSAIWMEPQYVEIRRDERGRFVKPHWEEKACQRCDELKHGAPVRRDLVIIGKDGKIEREEHTEHEQREPEED